MSKSFADKVSELQRNLDEGTKKVASKEWGFNPLLIAGGLAPFVLFLLLFFLQPSFVQREENGKFVRDNKKVFYWTVAGTAIAWLGLYLYTWCTGVKIMG